MDDHREVMQALAIEKGWTQGIELGLGSGLLFQRFLSVGVRMIGVDIGNRPERKAGIEAMCADPELRGFVERVWWKTTDQAADLVPDAWADFIFIDAAHSYDAVRRDIANWLPKVRPGGWFGGHDYHEAHSGVIRAVDEAFGKDGIELLDGWIWVRK